MVTRDGALVSPSLDGARPCLGRSRADSVRRCPSGEDPSHWEPMAGPLEIEGLVPVHDGRRWSTEIYVLIGVPYAWTEGHTAYAMESSLTVPELPPLLQQHQRVPARVIRFLRGSPRYRLGGVSTTRPPP